MAKKQGMTEAEWLAGANPLALLNHIEGLARGTRTAWPHRKFRLFACAVGRWAWPLLGHEASRAAVAVGEQFADGQATTRVLNKACREADRVKDALDPSMGAGRAAATSQEMVAFFASAVAMWTCASGGRDAASFAASLFAHAAAASAGEPTPVRMAGPDRAGRPLARLSDLVREVFGNPFRPVTIETAWLGWDGGAVPKLARSAYDERRLPEGALDAERLTVLADALEEAGCGDADILAHLRAAGPHVRGCWAVDKLLYRP